MTQAKIITLSCIIAELAIKTETARGSELKSKAQSILQDAVKHADLAHVLIQELTASCKDICQQMQMFIASLPSEISVIERQKMNKVICQTMSKIER